MKTPAPLPALRCEQSPAVLPAVTICPKCQCRALKVTGTTFECLNCHTITEAKK